MKFYKGYPFERFISNDIPNQTDLECDQISTNRNVQVRMVNRRLSDIPKDIIDSCTRADVFQSWDWERRTVKLVSMNIEEPLTDDEKTRMIIYFGLRCLPFDIKFID